MINCTIGGGIFGVPGEWTHPLGAASPLALIGGAPVPAVVIACIAEIASPSPESGGIYLYLRRAFEQLAGLQAAQFCFAYGCGRYRGDRQWLRLISARRCAEASGRMGAL
jgi:amino acid transporter